MWVPLVASLVLLVVVAAVHWSIWTAFQAELRKNAGFAIPIVVVLAATVLLPPLAWAIAAL